MAVSAWMYKSLELCQKRFHEDTRKFIPLRSSLSLKLIDVFSQRNAASARVDRNACNGIRRLGEHQWNSAQREQRDDTTA